MNNKFKFKNGNLVPIKRGKD